MIDAVLQGTRNWHVEVGDALTVLRSMPDECVQCCVTSPPYWGLRDYQEDGQLGLEKTPDEYVAKMVDVFREVRRVLRGDGTVWLNLGDSYAGSWGNQGRKEGRGEQRPVNGEMLTPVHDGRYPAKASNTGAIPAGSGLKPKDMVGIPWRVAFALQADGWYLRSDIIWAKPNPMPESVTDRPTKSHEYVFLLTKSARYFWDQDAVREEGTGREPGNTSPDKAFIDDPIKHRTRSNLGSPQTATFARNIRDVWTIATQPFPGAHFATFPPKLVEPCIKAGSAESDIVLDPFSGAGTTGMVARRLGRRYVGIELNPEYAKMSRKRITGDAPLFNTEESA